jgi:hypothetical protein
MEYLIAICGFLGAWLLVIGPVWQAAIELREEEIDQEAIEAAKASVPMPPKISRWWWLLPPVAYFKQSRRARASRKLMMDAMPAKQVEQTISFMNKANGWIIVAGGAFLLAVKETWELIELLHWPVWLFWVLVVLLPIVAIVNAVSRVMLTEHLIHPDRGPVKPPPGRGPRRAPTETGD